MSADANAITEKFRKIMGPVANTMAKEAAKECGGTISEEQLVIDDKKIGQFKQLMKKKCGKIIGERLAETIINEE